MIKKSWLKYLVAFTLWVVSMALGIGLIIIARSAFQLAIGLGYVKGDEWRATQVVFYAQALVFVLGLVWLVIMIVTEELFRTAKSIPLIIRKFAQFTGPELVVFFLVDLSLVFLTLSFSVWYRWLILAVELIAAIGLIYIGWFRPKPTTLKS